MSGYTSLLTNKVKMNFLTDPSSLLLEIKETMILDCSDIASIIEDHAQELFFSPVLGVYRPNNHKPLFTSHEKLFTHKSAFEFFPEIVSPSFAPGKGRETGTFQYAGQVGKRVDWREAIENPINVYNEIGRLVLKATDKRDKFVFNPGPEIYVRQFTLDLSKYFIYDAVPWGETDQVIAEMVQYAAKDIDIEETVKNLLSKLHMTGYFKAVTSFIEKDPFLVYHINSIGNNVLVESSCDFRHFKCNQTLWEQENARGKDDELFETYRNPEQPFGRVKFEELGELFKRIQDCTGKPVSDLTGFYTLLEESKQDVNLTKVTMATIDKFLQEKSEIKSSSRQFINKIMQNKNVRHHSFDFNQTTGVYFL